MASELLFDLDGIDLTRISATSEDVARINPQSGHMRMLDHVIWSNTDFTCGVGVKLVRADEFWVAGHIPGRPLFPGVLMIEAAAQLSSYLFKSRAPDIGFLGFTHCDNTVFRGQVAPGERLLLLVKEKHFGRRRFTCFAQGLVDRRLVFETLITGMAI